jgi:hypothetical protein
MNLKIQLIKYEIYTYINGIFIWSGMQILQKAISAVTRINAKVEHGLRRSVEAILFLFPVQ